MQRTLFLLYILSISIFYLLVLFMNSIANAGLATGDVDDLDGFTTIFAIACAVSIALILTEYFFYRKNKRVVVWVIHSMGLVMSVILLLSTHFTNK
ncbi:hypothetical protein IM792_17465 [Mucilaginibacter sp. JRF]|uniref:hypothetical protein n=1 Tax=Mucilaginibacter sp. JRF TaxID=2780088 RepID=UPI00187FCDDD|nr:hypothetical protein [Mucilaginibacter sp. JRF]MBE9586246.1 hypothetical protein [Mucilaginibacter sp. JRF]